MTTNVTKLKKPYPKDRKTPVKLTADEKYTVYKYAVENHCLAQEGDLYKFRVPPDRVAQEINRLGMFKGRIISSYHVKDAVEDVIDWQSRLNKIPPMPIETAELEQLKIFKIKALKEIEQYKLELEDKHKTIGEYANDALAMQKEIERLKKIPSDAQQRLEEIKRIVLRG